MPTIPTRLPTFDARRTPSDPASAGKQAAIDLWGVGKKTVERLKEKLRLHPTATPTVADFAYTNLDTFFRFYNEQRPHSAFGTAEPKTPMEVYRQPVPLAINQ